jgi:hypothetical protein
MFSDAHVCTMCRTFVNVRYQHVSSNSSKWLVWLWGLCLDLTYPPKLERVEPKNRPRRV